MNKIKIRRTSSNSVGSINKTQFSNIELQSTSKMLLNGVDSANINLNKLFLSERENSRNYRIIVTVNPYCTNVLFNPCTEVTNGMTPVTNTKLASCADAMGKNTKISLTDMVRNTEYSSEKLGYEYHPGLDIFNNHIIRNKSYRIVNTLPASNSNEERKNNFNTIKDYMRLDDGTVLKKCCRLDIEDTTSMEKHLYNADDILSFGNGDAIKENLREKDGWFGFYNTSTIDAKDTENKSLDINRVINNKGNCEFIDMYPDRTLFSFAPQYNKYMSRPEYNWDIVLTYPFAHTVKDENGMDIHVVQSGGRNGLFVVDAKMLFTPSGGIGVMFRTLTRHNLSKGDIVHMYYNENCSGEDNSSELGSDYDGTETGWYPVGEDFVVYSTGDQEGKNNDYYFTISNIDLLNKVFCTPKQGEPYTPWEYISDYFYKEIADSDVPILDFGKLYHVNELVKRNNKYYICYNENHGDMNENDYVKYFIELDKVCRKYDSTIGMCNMPTNKDHYIKLIGDSDNNDVYYTLYNNDTDTSFINASHNMTCDEFIMGIVNNAFRTEDDDTSYDSDDDTSYDSNGRWCDYISFRVVKVVDDVECEYYVRKFKKFDDLSSEFYKLGFSRTIYGDDVAQMTYTDTINTENFVDNRGRELTDIYVTIIKRNKGYDKWYLNQDSASDIEMSRCFGPVTSGFDFFADRLDGKNIRNKRKSDYDVRFLYNTVPENGTDFVPNFNLNNHFVSSDNEWFYGDIVEYCPTECMETSLCDVNFRFNTAQRELGANDDYLFMYDEIVKDDYDGEFAVAKYDGAGNIIDEENSESNANFSIEKHEGYYYNPHYRIRLRGFGDINQDSHRALFVKSAEPYQSNGMFIKVTTSVSHKLAVGNKVILYFNDSDETVLDVVGVLNPYTFIMNKMARGAVGYKDYINICVYLNKGEYKLNVLNEEIPSYAMKLSNGTYIWRDTVGLWNSEPQIEYTFANGALYVDNCINFYLKRQNGDRSLDNDLPDKIGGERNYTDFEGLKNDKPSNYDYIDEVDNKC